MRLVTPHRLAATFAALSALALAHGQAPSESTDYPALSQQASAARLPGKFIWADLYTDDPAAAAKFYGELFGWTARSHEKNGRTHIVMSNNGQPIAAIVSRKASSSNHTARWIGFIAAPDAAAAISAATAAGGKTLAPSREFSRLGTRAIIADPEGAPVGILQSASGDPADFPSKAGDWAWFELFSKNPQAEGQFYASVFHYDVSADSRGKKENHYILATGQSRRGGIQPVVPGDPAEWLPFIQVADLDVAIAHSSQLGGQIVAPPAQTELGSRFAIITDSTGGTVGLVQFVDDVNPSTAAPGTPSNPQ